MRLLRVHTTTKKREVPFRAVTCCRMLSHPVACCHIMSHPVACCHEQVAFEYAKDNLPMVYEIQMGMVDRGADLSWLSQARNRLVTAL